MRTTSATVAVFAALLEFASGCGRSSPSGPSAPPPGALPPAGPPPAAASLVIERPFIVVYPQNTGDPFGYDTRFEMRETSRMSGATIQNVAIVAANGGSDNTGPGCWQNAVRVPAGGTLDIFYSDAGHAWLSYCAPWSGGRAETPELRVVVTFTDDDGRTGTTQATARVSK